MALEPGGYADKLGNRYEGRWIVRQLLRVLSEDIQSITVEKVGEEEQGVDLCIEHIDGSLQAQQCKIRNRSSDSWSINDLGNRSIFTAMRLFLEQDAANEFAFVTAVPSTILKDICDSARKSSGNPVEFYEHQIQSIGEARRKAFTQFCKHLDLNKEVPSDLAMAYSFLSRFYIELWPDTRTNTEDLHDQAQVLVVGDPKTTVAVLADFAMENLRRRLDSHSILQHLKSCNLHSRQLEHDSRIAPAINSLQQQFLESISADLIGGELIPRSETEKILKAIDNSTVIAIHGSPGQGKSGVLYELARRCEADGRVCLALRLDRQEPQNNPQQFGINIGLPESPALCLDSVAGNRPSILILDQLDAIRWTSRNSLNGLEVCKSIVRQVRCLRNLGRKIGVVLACRTYDMQNDLEIKKWLAFEKTKEDSVVEIRVEPLSPDTVASVVKKVGQDAGKLSSRQKDILRSPHHLAMWVRIVKSKGAFEFQNRVQLIRGFMTERMIEISNRGVSESDARGVLKTFVDYMEKNSRLSSPSTLFTNLTTLNALLSSGLLRESNGQITFAHQSYLDYEIASRVVREIHTTGKDIVDWLGPRNSQSLFRREQLRQALCLLSDDSPEQFLTEVRSILDSSKVRFHLKHLCLEVIGQIDSPDSDLIDFLLELCESNKWKEHIIASVFLNHSPFILRLIKIGTIGIWLESEDQRSNAIWLLRSVVEEKPDDVAELLRPYAERDDEWRILVLRCLPWHAEDDSECMFGLRLDLARVGVFSDYVNWKKLSLDRVLPLLDALLTSWGPEDFQERFNRKAGKRSRIEHWSAEDSSTILEAACADPNYAWNMVVGHIIRLAPDSIDDIEMSTELWLDSDLHGIRQSMEGIPHGLVCMGIEAGKLLAESMGDEFWEATKPLRESTSPVIRYLLIESYSSLPDSHADASLLWLIADQVRLSAGTGYYEPEWMPAARLLSALTSVVSKEVFEVVEHTIFGYHDPNELINAKNRLPHWKYGCYDYWGRAQHFLLPALCSIRRSSKTNALILVLQRKYEKYSPERFTRGMHGHGGFVGSTLPKDLLRLSDGAWLRLISSEKITEDEGFRYRDFKEDHVSESSIRQFARNLENVAKRFPERFGRLALRFPAEVNSMYVAAILEGLKLTEPVNVPEDEKCEWRPAPVELIEEVMIRFGDNTDREYAKAFCWLMYKRAEESWSQSALNQLIRYALEHPNPTPDKLAIGNGDGDFSTSNATVENLWQNTINTVRSVAALAIGRQLWNHPDTFEQLKETVLKLCLDPSPVVRTAAVDTCLPILNIDKDFAIECFCAASKEDIRIGASHQATYFFNGAIESHHSQLAPIIRLMFNSSREDVARKGAKEVTARWLFHDYFEDEKKQCLQGSNQQRIGMAKIAVQFVETPEYFERCQAIILNFMDDSDSEVRKAVNKMARSSEIFKHENGRKLVLQFVESQSFRDDPTSLIFGLEEHSGNLLGFAELLFAMCKQFVGPLREASRDTSQSLMWDIDQFVPILIRLYEQAEEAKETDIVDHCLDAWDEMFKQRVGMHILSTAIA